MKTRTLHWRLTAYAALAFLLLAGTVAAYAEDTAEKRLSTTSQGQGIERGSIGDGVISHDEREPLVTTGERGKTARVAGQQKLSASAAQSGSLDFWIYDADVQLYSDLDRDGYYVGIDLLFDADTTYAVADVYAVIYLSYEFGPWNEYVSTEDFTIFGASSGDEYIVDTELVSGYPTGDYDILIELFDAYDGTFLTSFGPDESSELSYLPLEDIGRDTPPGNVVIVNEGGGATSWFLLLSVLGALILRRRSSRG
tara:strand:+ start:1757 stop:2518 length:762 start_codon:yes stop_codon:yes gene_type:complete